MVQKWLNGYFYFLDDTVRKWKTKLLKADGAKGDAILRHGRGCRGKDKAVTKRWERCKQFMDNQAEFIACCVMLLKV